MYRPRDIEWNSPGILSSARRIFNGATDCIRKVNGRQAVSGKSNTANERIHRRLNAGQISTRQRGPKAAVLIFRRVTGRNRMFYICHVNHVFIFQICRNDA